MANERRFSDGRILVVAFEGWNDAGEAASGAVTVLRDSLGLAPVHEVDPEVYFDYQGLRTVSDLNLNLRSDREEGLVLGGEIVVTDGSFRRDLNYGSEVIRALSGGGNEIEITKNRSAMLEHLRYRTTVRTTSPIAVDNNLAKIGIDSNLQLVGSYYAPSLLNTRVPFGSLADCVRSAVDGRIVRDETLWLG